MPIRIIHRTKFPPFSSTNFDAKEVPVSKLEYGYDSIDSIADKFPAFYIASEDGWFVEREIISDDGESIQLNYEEQNVAKETKLSETETFDPIIEAQRLGWYIRPHPIHMKTRNLVNISVIILLMSLVYLFISPALSSFGIPTFGTSNIRIGLLDYPVLALFVVPIVSIPFLLKIGANIGDLRRQKLFLKNAPEEPKITIIDEPVSGNHLSVQVEFKEFRDDWNDVRVLWRVGALPPERSAIFEANGRDFNGQPPPGMTTEIPNKWIQAFDDGTAGGEDAPMEIANVRGGMFLRPMRIMETGGTSQWKSSDEILKLDGPENCWPGTFYTPLLKIHWELIVSIQRQKGGPLLFVKPLVVKPSTNPTKISNAVVNDGRAEFDSDLQT